MPGPWCTVEHAKLEEVEPQHSLLRYRQEKAIHATLTLSCSHVVVRHLGGHRNSFESLSKLPTKVRCEICYTTKGV